ncbi:MAG: ATP-binding protein, partial [candidate division NC10 bacterium]
ELYRLTIALQEAIPLGERLDLILEGAHEVLDLDRIGIFLPDPEGTTLECRAVLGVAEDPLERLRVPLGPEGGAIALAYREARDVVWEGPGAVPPEYRLPGPAAAIGSFRSRAFAMLPLLSRGRAIGVLVADNKVSRRPLPQETVDLLRVFSQQAAIALENARLYAELKGSTQHLEESRRNLEELHRLSIAIQEAASLEERLGHVLRGAHEILALDWINIFLPDEGRTALRCVARVGGGEEPLEALTVPLGPAGGGLARAFLEKTDVCWNGEGPVPEGLRLHSPYAHVKPLRARIFANIPLVARGEAIGVIAAGNPETRRPIQEETRSFLRIFAAHAAIAIENARLYKSLKEHSATLEQRIEERTKELAEASRQKSRFLASMSHELRTPLNAILGFSEVLLDRFVGDLTPKQVEYLESIHASGKHLLGLINDILDLSKIEAGKMVLHPEPCYLPQTLEDALTLVRSEAIRKRLTPGLEVAPEVGLIEADPAKLKQILYNLLSNAIKFTPEGGQVTVRGRRVGSLVEVAVADTGIGIRPADQERIFGEFEQVDSAYARQVQGTGLGLPLTRRLVELHGGTLTLESAEGEGSTFTFTLPLRIPQPAPA